MLRRVAIEWVRTVGRKVSTGRGFWKIQDSESSVKATYMLLGSFDLETNKQTKNKQTNKKATYNV